MGHKNHCANFWTRLIYVIIWSLVLLYATFHSMFENRNYFDFQNDWNIHAKEYIAAMILTMMIFIIDAVYNQFLTKKDNSAPILIGFVSFFFFMLLSLSYGRGLFFLIGWIILTWIKFYTTDTIPETDILAFKKSRDN